MNRSPVKIFSIWLSMALVASPTAIAEETCFEPAGAVQNDWLRYDEISARSSLLEYKKQNKIFDLRLCDEDWECPGYAGALAEREAIVAQAQAHYAVVAAYAADKAVESTLTSMVYESLAKPFRKFTPKNKKSPVIGRAGTAKTSAEWMSLALDRARYAFQDHGPQIEDEVRQTTESLATATHEYNSAKRAYTKIQELESKYADRPSALQVRFPRGVDAQKDSIRLQIQMTEKNLRAVKYNHQKSLAKRQELDNALASLDQGQQLLKNLDNLVTAVSAVDNAKKRDYVKSAKDINKLMKVAVDWNLAGLAADKTQLEASITRAFQRESFFSRQPKMREGMGLNSSALLDDIIDLQRSEMANVRTQEIVNSFKDTLALVDSALKIAEETQKFQKYLEKLRKSKERSAGRVSTMDLYTTEETRRFLAEFKRLEFALKELKLALARSTAIPQAAIIAEIVEYASLMAQAAHTLPVKFTQFTKAQAQQGGIVTESGEYLPPHPMFVKNPTLADLKLFMSQDRPEIVVPGPKMEHRTLPLDSLNALMTAATLFSSISGRSPNQAELRKLADGHAMRFSIPSLEDGRLVIEKELYSTRQMTETQTRRRIEEAVGGFVHRMTLLNDAVVATSNKQFKFATLMKDAAERQRFNTLSERYERLNRAMRVAHDQDLSTKLYGAILAQYGQDGTGKSTLEDAILRARDKALDRKKSGEPVSVGWIKAQQNDEAWIEVGVGLEIGALSDGERVCHETVVRYPDGSFEALRTNRAEPGQSALVSTFSYEHVDWEKLASSRTLTIESQASARGVTSRKEISVDLVEPVRITRVDAFAGADVEASDGVVTTDAPANATACAWAPNVADTDVSYAFPGDDVELQIFARVWEKTSGYERPQAMFYVRPEAGSALPIPATEEKLSLGLYGRYVARFQVPESAQPGDVFFVEGSIAVDDFETRKRTRFEIARDPDVDLADWQPRLRVLVKREVAGTDPDSYPPAAGMPVTIEGDVLDAEGVTDPYGVANFVPRATGSFTARVSPDAATGLGQASGSTSVDFGDDPCAQPASAFDITLVLPARDRDVAGNDPDPDPDGSGDPPRGPSPEEVAGLTARGRTLAGEAADVCSQVTGDRADLERELAELEAALTDRAGTASTGPSRADLETLAIDAERAAQAAYTDAQRLAELRQRAGSLRDRICNGLDQVNNMNPADANRAAERARSEAAQASAAAAEARALMDSIRNHAGRTSGALSQANAAVAAATGPNDDGTAALSERLQALIERNAQLAEASDRASELAQQLDSVAGQSAAASAQSPDDQALAAAALQARDAADSARMCASMAQRGSEAFGARLGALRGQLVAPSAPAADAAGIADLVDRIAAANDEAQASLSTAELFADSVDERAGLAEDCADMVAAAAAARDQAGDGWSAGGLSSERSDPQPDPQPAPAPYDPQVEGWVAAAGQAISQCRYSDALAYANRIRQRDPTHPWVSANYDWIAQNADQLRRQRTELRQLLVQLSSQKKVKHLKRTQQALEALRANAGPCLADDLAGALAAANGRVRGARQERNQRIARGLGGLLAAGAVAGDVIYNDGKGTEALIDALDGQIDAPPPPEDDPEPPAGQSPGGGPSGDPCKHKYTYPSMYSPEPICDCPGYKFVLAWCERDPNAPQQPAGGGSGGQAEEQHLDDIVVGTYDVTISVWDWGCLDGDVISLWVNGRPLLTNYTLTKEKKTFDVQLQAVNTIEVLSVDPGDDCGSRQGQEPLNAAAITVSNAKSGGSQRWRLRRGARSTARVTVQP